MSVSGTSRRLDECDDSWCARNDPNAAMGEASKTDARRDAPIVDRVVIVGVLLGADFFLGAEFTRRYAFAFGSLRGELSSVAAPMR